MTDRPDTESFEARLRRLEHQRVSPEEEARKTPTEAEDRMETAEEEAAPPAEDAATGTPQGEPKTR